MYLKELTLLDGISGDEKAVRDFLVSVLYDDCDEISVDVMGNLICKINGTAQNPKKVMVCAHMDEVGLIVSRITSDGFLKFKTVGGIDPRVLISKPVRIGEKKVCGVIGAKAIHLQTKEEKKCVLKSTELYIDIGAKNKSEAERYVSVGDSCCFDSDYVEFGNGCVKAKALDDRVGCACMIALAKRRYPFDLYLVFTVQEEVGTRGAKVAAHRIAPNMAIVLEGTTCSDVYGCMPKEYSTTLGKGPVLSVADCGTVYNKPLFDKIMQCAHAHNIPVQVKETLSGGNDAAAIHVSGGGIPTAAVSVPTRYIHSPSSVIKKSDYAALLRLVQTFLQEETIQ